MAGWRSNTSAGRGGRRRAGFTLVETVMALGMTCMIGLAIATMFFAIGSATADRNNRRALVVQRLVLTNRLAAAIRGSRMVLAAGTNYLVLWVNDDNGDDQPNLSELRRISIDTKTGLITSNMVAWPAGTSQATIDSLDLAYDPATTDFDKLTSSLLTANYFPATSYASGVTAATITLNNASAQSASLVSLTLTITSNGASETLIAAAGPRNP